MLSSAEYLDFEIALRYDYRTEQALIAIRGELDVLTADDLRRALEGAAAGRTALVLDLADLKFCDARGLRVIADIAKQLNDRGGGLRLQSPRPTLTTLLDITGLHAVVTVAGDAAPRFPERNATDTEQLAQAIADSVAPLAYDALTEAIMRMVATIAPKLVDAVDHASVTMRRQDRFVTVACSDPLATELDQVQYDADAGPCVEAAATGQTVHGYPASEISRWDALRDPARKTGIYAVLSTPFLADGGSIGALNLYARDTDFNDSDFGLASLLVDEAATLLDAAPLDRQALIERLQDGLADRDGIAQAQGMIMERDNLSAPQAFTRLRRDSTVAETLMTDTAAQVVEAAIKEHPAKSAAVDAP